MFDWFRLVVVTELPVSVPALIIPKAVCVIEPAVSVNVPVPPLMLRPLSVVAAVPSGDDVAEPIESALLPLFRVTTLPLASEPATVPTLLVDWLKRAVPPPSRRSVPAMIEPVPNCSARVVELNVTVPVVCTVVEVPPSRMP